MLPHNPDSATLDAIDEVFVALPAGEPRRIRIVGRRRHKNFILLRFAGIVSANAADELVGSVVSIPREQLPELDEGELYHIDLIGSAVESVEGEALGEVVEILQTGSNDVLVVHGQGPTDSEGEREILVPWIDDVVVEVDSDAKKIVIEIIPGLLEE